jgi:uncharacterized protein YyaL (SSP411 family)
VAVLRPSNEEAPAIDRLAGFVRGHRPVDGKAAAYVCRGNACQAPVTDVYAMLEGVNRKK